MDDMFGVVWFDLVLASVTCLDEPYNCFGNKAAWK